MQSLQKNDKPTASSHAAIIRARNLSRTYTLGESRITGVDAVDLEIAAGELVLLTGVSGSGKSTLLSLLAGLDRPTAGELTVAGRDLSQASGASLDDYRRHVVGMVFQSFNLMPTLDVLENVCLPALLAGRPMADVRKRATELLGWLNLGPRLAHLPAQLSGGEMQRTAIARALINDPAVILADEPTGNLDSRNGAVVIDLLTELNRASGKTIVIATHGGLADKAATRRIRLGDGRIQWDG
ncbi:ABC transporter ATP-binding protein [Desulfococcus sp.]|uniref:ABC transporter ATP-binding protein n=1 Tax=Desulfococcus sp. TaxID=2025834 RepID=UPI0035937F82